MLASAAAGDPLTIDGLTLARGAWRLVIERFNIAPNERLLLLGPSGSGKTSLLLAITGLLPIQRGSVRLGGADMARMTAGQRDRWRGEQIGFIPQTLNLLPFASARQNVAAALRFAPQRRARLTEGAVAALLAELGLAAEQQRRPVARLSQGQQQRVAIARALIGAPALIIADEPTSALDPSNATRFLDLLFLRRQTLLMVSHDDRIAPGFDRVLTMQDLLAP